MQALVTGAYFASFLLCLRWLIFSDDGENLRKGISWPFLMITLVLFAFAVTAFAINLQFGPVWVSEGCSGVGDAALTPVRNLITYHDHRGVKLFSSLL